MRRDHKLYRKLLNYEPKYYLINEQVYNDSMDSLYLDHKIKNIIIDCDYSIKNPLNKFNHSIKKRNGVKLQFSHSFLTQITQDYVQGRIDLKEALKIFNKISKNSGYFCLYSSDAECFNFRAHRYSYEKDPIDNEWEKFETLLNSLDKKYDFIDFDKVKSKNSDHEFTNINNPYHIKKQEKFNISRWANTGWNDLYLNTLVNNNINKFEIFDDKKKIEYLFLASSDLRTHTSQDKKIKSKNIIERLKLIPPKKIKINFDNIKNYHKNYFKNINYEFCELGNFFKNNIYKFGLYNDLYSFHIIGLDYRNKKKYTDLPNLYSNNENTSYYNISRLNKDLIHKKILLKKNLVNFSVKFKNKFNKNFDVLRIPLTFHIKNKNDTYLKFNDGNSKKNILKLSSRVNYIGNIYDFISVKNLVYSTNGEFEITSKNKRLQIKFNLNYSNPPLLIQTYVSNNQMILRLIISLNELDETSNLPKLFSDLELEIKYKEKK